MHLLVRAWGSVFLDYGSQVATAENPPEGHLHSLLSNGLSHIGFCPSVEEFFSGAATLEEPHSGVGCESQIVESCHAHQLKL